jgi:hypothetical protein
MSRGFAAISFRQFFNSLLGYDESRLRRCFLAHQFFNPPSADQAIMCRGFAASLHDTLDKSPLLASGHQYNDSGS